MNRTFVAASALVLASALPACGTKAASTGSSSGDAGAISQASSCDSDTTAVPFSKGMNLTGPNGINVAITSAPPEPTLGDHSRWDLMVTDTKAGGPVPDGTSVSIVCLMTHTNIPSHGCPVTPTVKAMGGGAYQGYPVIFNMTGHWEVTFKVGTLDSVKFPLCIQ